MTDMHNVRIPDINDHSVWLLHQSMVFICFHVSSSIRAECRSAIASQSVCDDFGRLADCQGLESIEQCASRTYTCVCVCVYVCVRVCVCECVNVCACVLTNAVDV